jgi:hypothetical protein
MRKNADITAVMSVTSCSQVYILEIKKKLLWKFEYSSFSHSDVTSEHLLPYATGVACDVWATTLSFRRRGALSTVLYLGKKKLCLIQNVLDPV